MITEINCSMLESPSDSDDNEINTDIPKPTSLEPTKILNEGNKTFPYGITKIGKEGKQYKSKNIPNGKIYAERN